MLGVNSVRSYVLDSSVWTANVKSWYEEGNNSLVGYYTCTTNSSTAAKTVNDASGYVLSLGGSMKIKFTNKNTTSNPTLNINGQGAKSIIYDGSTCSSTNTWEDGETVEAYYDGSVYQLNNVAGGGTFKNGEKVKNVGIDDEPTAGSDNLVKSGGVEDSIKKVSIGTLNEFASISAIISSFTNKDSFLEVTGTQLIRYGVDTNQIFALNIISNVNDTFNIYLADSAGTVQAIFAENQTVLQNESYLRMFKSPGGYYRLKIVPSSEETIYSLDIYKSVGDNVNITVSNAISPINESINAIRTDLTNDEINIKFLQNNSIWYNKETQNYSSSGTGLIRFDNLSAQTSKPILIEIITEENLSITELCKSNSSGGVGQIYASNIQISANDSYRCQFNNNQQTLSYIKVVGAENNNFTINLYYEKNIFVVASIQEQIDAKASKNELTTAINDEREKSIQDKTNIEKELDYSNTYTASHNSGTSETVVMDVASGSDIGLKAMSSGSIGVLVVVSDSSFIMSQIGISNSSGTITQVIASNISITANVPKYITFTKGTSTSRYMAFKGSQPYAFTAALYFNEGNRVSKNSNEILRLDAVTNFLTKETLTINDNKHFMFSENLLSGKNAIIEITANSDTTVPIIQAINRNEISIPVNIASVTEFKAWETKYYKFTSNSNKLGGISFGDSEYSSNLSVSVYLDERIRSNALFEQVETDYRRDMRLLVPSYFEEQLTEKIPIIQNNMNAVGRNGETFVFITDPHWSNNAKNSPYLIKNILDNTNVNLIVCGGDVVVDTTKQLAINMWQDFLHKVEFPNIPIYFSYGNHDGNYNRPTGAVPSQTENDRLDFNAVFALSHKQSSMTEHFITDSGFNYYFDRPDTKTRFIVLDLGDSANSTNYVNYNNRPFVFDGIKAMCSLLRETPQGYHVILVPHAMRNSSQTWESVSSEIVSTYPLVWESTNIICNIVDTFNLKSTYTIDNTNYDFANSYGEIVCVIAGHEHQDKTFNTTNGFPIIVTDTDGYNTNAQEGATLGTITEQAFDIVTIDYTNKTIKCVRIGRGIDRNFTY